MMRTLRGWLTGWLWLVGVVVCAQGQAATLTSLDIAQRADGGIDAILGFDGPIPAVHDFRTDSPAQVVIDLPNTESRLEQRSIAVEQGGLRAIHVADTGERTRLVFRLASPQAYSVQRGERRLRVRLGATEATA